MTGIFGFVGSVDYQRILPVILPYFVGPVYFRDAGQTTVAENEKVSII